MPSALCLAGGNLMREFNSENESDDIDYLHPQGKPEREKAPEADDGKPSWRQLRIALDEADGHYMKKPDPYLDDEDATE
jgi:hypothetical protein